MISRIPSVYLVHFVNILLLPFRLHWNNKTGLMYHYPFIYGNIGVNITKDFDKVLYFLKLPKNYMNISNILEFIKVLEECKYLNLPLFFKYNLNTPTNLQNFHKKILEYIVDNKYVFRFSNFIFVNNRLAYIYKIDKDFEMNGDFIRRIKRFERYKISSNRRFIKHKFNGKIIKQWLPGLCSGKKVKDIMDAFRSYIESELNTPFNVYVKKYPFKGIRTDFKEWYEDTIGQLDSEFNNLIL